MTLICRPWKTNLALSGNMQGDRLTPKDISHGPQILPSAALAGANLSHSALAFPGLGGWDKAQDVKGSLVSVR